MIMNTNTIAKMKKNDLMSFFRSFIIKTCLEISFFQ